MSKRKSKRSTSQVAEGPSSATTAFPIVGVGASAGGLQALRGLFAAMPTDTGMAFVVIQHLDPVHESHMAELLQSHTAMPVRKVDEPESDVQPNRVYVIAPASELALEGGKLRLRQPSGTHHDRHPVDVFLVSLAEEAREGAIGVVLSGTGSDGTAGLQAIKAHGGMSIAQDPGDAVHASMPQSAIDAGASDYVLALEHIPETLVAYGRHSYAMRGEPAPLPPEGTEQQIGNILSLLLVRTGQDFRSYKNNTVARRIYRRMGIKGTEELDRYVQILRARPDEIDALAEDLRIGVTGFFRDAESWNRLRELVLRPLVQQRKPDAPIRVWIPGCASGEEAYSLTIALLEESEAEGRRHPLQIFATDVAEQSLQAGRRAWFPDSISHELTHDQLCRFFYRENHGYRVNQRVRDMVTFATHNLLSDPPFSHIDLVSCRNLLIYLESEVQQKVLSVLHFALRNGGYLFLGTAETIGSEVRLFEVLSGKHSIYRACRQERRGSLELPVFGAVSRATDEGKLPLRARGQDRPAELAQRTLLQQYAPASVLIDDEYCIHYFHGPTERYLAQPDGEPTHSLLEMARPGMSARLRSAIHSSRYNDERVVVSGQLHRNEEREAVRISVTPVRSNGNERSMLLVSFEDIGRPDPDESDSVDAADEHGSSERKLEEELYSTRRELEASIEELEASNEELKASNEEITSMNEELQSTNEELESSKEELQSLNEELSTLNKQLETKLSELEQSNDDLTNLLASTDVATLHLDTELRIRWLTRLAKELLGAIDSDLGRPVSQLADRFVESHFIEDAQTVLDKLAPLERVAQHQDSRWYRRRIQPYRTHDNRIEGVVVTFADVTGLKSREEELERRVADRTAELEDTVTRLRRLAAELNATEQRERRQLGKVLHDECQQTIVAAKMKLSAVAASLGNREAADQVADAVAYIDQTVSSMRTLAAELCPPMLETVGLLEVLRQLADRMGQRHGLHVEVGASKDAPDVLSDDLRAFVYQSIRELLFNVVKHAETDRARVDLSGGHPGYLRVVVADNGKGCDPRAVLAQDEGFGIPSIRERLLGLGGRFSFQADDPEKGCHVTLDVPLDTSD